MESCLLYTSIFHGFKFGKVLYSLPHNDIKPNDKIDCNVQYIINECEQSEVQESINDEFRSNFEQFDAIKINVTSLKNKQAEHECEIIKVREDLNVTINQIFTNVSERDLYRELYAILTRT